MNNNSNDIKQWIQELIKRSASEQILSIQRINQLLQRVTRSDIDQQTLKEEYLRFFREESTRYVNDLTNLGLSFYNALLELNSSYNDRFFDELLDVTNHTADGSGSAPTTAQRIELALQGPVGTDITKSFVLENKQPASVEISFLISDFVNASSSYNRFRPPLQLEPPRFSLGPGEERVVNLRLSLLAPLFVPGQLYAGSVVVRGHEDLILALKVQAESAAYHDNGTAEQATNTPQATTESTANVNSRANGAALLADDLTRIKGIGPFYADKFHQAGITSFIQLAALDEQSLIQVVGAAAAQRAGREMWQHQARLAAASDESNLIKLQAQLSHAARGR